MDHILVSVYCPAQNEHIAIKKVASIHVEVIFKNVENTQKFTPTSSSSSLSHLFCPGSFS